MKRLLAAGTVAIALTVFTNPAPAQDAAAGKTLYEKGCASCHGVQGTPSPAMAKAMKVPVLDSAFVAARAGDSLLAAFKANPKHNSVKGKVKETDLPAIIEYVRHLSGAVKQ